MGRITLYRNAAGWHADMSAATDAAGIRSRFGTDQLPTAWTARAAWRDVLAAIATLNPSDAVQVDILSRECDACGQPGRHADACPVYHAQPDTGRA